MTIADQLRKGWEAGVLTASIEPTPGFTEAGLTLGAGTALARRMTDRRGRPALAIDGNEERMLALLAVAYSRAVQPSAIDNIRRASEHYACGEIALALIHLARAGIHTLADPKGAAYRLFVADALLDDGFSPRDLLKTCDIDPAGLDQLGKDFNPDEPRIPAGNGRESGERTIGYGPDVGAAGDGESGERTHDYGSNITPVADRQIPNEYRTIPTSSSTRFTTQSTLSPSGSASTKPGSSAWPRMKAAISTIIIAI